MSTLDAFLQPQLVKPNQRDSGIYVEERCSNSNCRKILGVKEPKYTIRAKGKEEPYCRECARAILPKPKPEEASEEASGWRVTQRPIYHI